MAGTLRSRTENPRYLTSPKLNSHAVRHTCVSAPLLYECRRFRNERTRSINTSDVAFHALTALVCPTAHRIDSPARTRPPAGSHCDSTTHSAQWDLDARTKRASRPARRRYGRIRVLGRPCTTSGHISRVRPSLAFEHVSNGRGARSLSNEDTPAPIYRGRNSRPSRDLMCAGRHGAFDSLSLDCGWPALPDETDGEENGLRRVHHGRVQAFPVTI